MESPKFASYLKAQLGYLPEITGSAEDQAALAKYVEEKQVESERVKKNLQFHIDGLNLSVVFFHFFYI